VAYNSFGPNNCHPRDPLCTIPSANTLMIMNPEALDRIVDLEVFEMYLTLNLLVTLSTQVSKENGYLPRKRCSFINGSTPYEITGLSAADKFSLLCNWRIFDIKRTELGNY